MPVQLLPVQQESIVSLREISMANHQIPNNSVYPRNEAKVAVVIVSTPFQGHQNQLLHLSRIISSYDDISVYFVGSAIHNRQARLRAQGWDPLTKPNLHFHDFPIPPFEAPSPDPNDPNKFPKHILPLYISYYHGREPTYALIHDLAKTSKRVVVIVDFMMHWMIHDVSSVPNAEAYVFHVFPAFAVYYIARKFAGKPVLIHGEPVEDLPPVDKVLGAELYQHMSEHLNTNFYNHGNLYNSCRAIEGEFLDLLAEEKVNDTDKHWGIGPFTPVSTPERKTTNKYLEWLDKQNPKSVIFISFGTTISLSDEQVKEIAQGLERSGQNFLWVLRYADTADFHEGESRSIQLPKGFEERAKGRGIIIRDWAPQLEILGHPSTGGFVSHCGWNSIIESISMGVPVAAWPVHSEQPVNAILLSRVLKMGLLVSERTAQINEIVKSEAVEKAVRRLMDSPEGDEMRQRAKELSTVIKQSIKEDGATSAEIASFIAHITR